MNDRMLLIVPSRNRPSNIKRLCEGLIATEADLDLAVGIDSDDSNIEEYTELANKYGFKLYVAEERKKFAATVNYISKLNYENYKYLSWMGDDHLPRTKNWDAEYRRDLDEMKVGVVYGDDLVQGKNIATELAFTSNIVGALGYAIPEGFVHLFVDNYFMILGESVDKLRYRDDVIVEHLHYSVGNSGEDQTYKEANSPANWSNDQRRFEEYKINELPADAEKLRRLLNV
jgi:hypothetical protein